MDADVPPITDELRRQARQASGSWIYSVAPGYDNSGPVPGSAVVGAWQVDQDGELDGFVPNPRYRPPVVTPPDAPIDRVDTAIQRAATSQGTDHDVISALAGATIYLPANSNRELIAYSGDTGETTVALFTDPSKAPPTVPFLLPAHIGAVLDQLPDDNEIVINPTAKVVMAVVSGELRRAIQSLNAPPPPATEGTAIYGVQDQPST